MIPGHARDQQKCSCSGAELSKGKFIQRYSLLTCLASSDPRGGSYHPKCTNPDRGSTHLNADHSARWTLLQGEHCFMVTGGKAIQVPCTTNSFCNAWGKTNRKINILDKVSVSFFVPSFIKYEGFKELQTKHKQHMSKFQNTWLIKA